MQGFLLLVHIMVLNQCLTLHFAAAFNEANNGHCVKKNSHQALCEFSYKTGNIAGIATIFPALPLKQTTYSHITWGLLAAGA